MEHEIEMNSEIWHLLKFPQQTWVNNYMKGQINDLIKSRIDVLRLVVNDKHSLSHPLAHLQAVLYQSPDLEAWSWLDCSGNWKALSEG